jgi:hypothetical protein
VIVALDLSPAGTGMVAGDPSKLLIDGSGVTDFNWRTLIFQSYGEKLDRGSPLIQHIHRRARVTIAISQFVTRIRPTALYVEAAMTHGGWNIADQAKLHGMVEHELLVQHHLLMQPVSLVSARKHAIGYVPRKTPKAVWQAPIRALQPSLAHGEIDALLVFNLAAHRLGYPSLQLPPQFTKNHPKVATTRRPHTHHNCRRCGQPGHNARTCKEPQ